MLGPTAKVAAIDCGTNSIRLLIAEGPAPLRDIHREMRIVRLGQGVDETRRFHPDALARTFAAARDYAAIIRAEGVSRVRFGATSATRDAENREEFLAGIEEIVGVRPEVITGPEEALLSFTGAARVITEAGTTALVVDLGGGSTEFVLGTVGADALTPLARSLDVGSVRLTERHLHSDPPTPAQIEAARTEVRDVVEGALAQLPIGEVDAVVGVAGTITTVTAHALGLERYVPEQINGARLEAGRIDAACADLLRRSRTQRAEVGVIHPGRIDVIGGGALVWQEILRSLAAEFERTGRPLGPVVTSEHDILDGLALSLL